MLFRKLLPQLRLLSRNTGNTMSASAVISYDDMKKLISSGNFQIFDVRTREEVCDGRISGSVNIPVTDIEDSLKMDPEAFKQKYLVEKPQPDDNNLVFHCQMGKRGQRASEIALGLGYKHARNYLGGYKEWSEKQGK